jgi:hypothetical protein
MAASDAFLAELLGRGVGAAQIAAARPLARPERWLSLSQGDNLVWGEIQGTARYRVAAALADPDGPGFSCTCPSQRKPCKHALALALAHVERPEAFAPAAPPEWVTAWAEARARARRRPRGEVADPEAQARRAAEREARVLAGLDELERWLSDLVRNGLAGVERKPYAFWDGPAARLVDAQAPGLARRVRSLAAVAASGPGWPERLLERLALLALLVTAYRRGAALPDELRAEVRQRVGWTVSQDELLAQAPALTDRWRVLGWRIEEDERLRSQRVWLSGAASGRTALLLDFAPPTAPLDTRFLPGTTVDADLVFFPGVRAQRALVKERRAVAPGVGEPRGLDLAAATVAYGAALAADPWLEETAVLLAGVTPVRRGEPWHLVDDAGRAVPLAARSTRGLTLAALSGGRPLAVFAEWNGRAVTPLAAFAEGRHVAFDA